MLATLLVVFDIDDTLYLERDYVRSGFLALDLWCRQNLGRTGFATLAWDLFEKGVRGDIIDRVLRYWNLSATAGLKDRLIDEYRGHDPQIALLPDSVECLNYLHGSVRMAVISDGPENSQRNKSHRLGLDQWMDKIVLTAEFGADYCKPSPKPFQALEALFQCNGARCAYVADNPVKDFQAPSVLGWRTIRVRRPGGLHANALPNTPVDHLVSDLKDVPALLGD